MRIIRPIHLVGITLAIGAFVLGSKLASRTNPGGDELSPGSNGPLRGASTSRSEISANATDSTATANANANPNVSGAASSDSQSTPGTDIARSPSILASSSLRTQAQPPGFKERPPLTDPKQINALVLKALQSLDPTERRKAFDQLLQSIAPENLEIIRSAMHQNGAGPNEWRLFDYAAGAEDPGAIADILARINEQHQKGYLQNTIPGWASTDPSTAIAYVDTLESGPFKEQLTRRMLEGLAVNDLTMATDYVLDLANAGNESASSYLRSLTDEVIRAKGFDGAPDWLSSIPNPDLQATATGDIARAYVKAQGEAVLPWLNSLDPGPARSQGYQEAFNTWANKNLEAATGQLNNLPPSADRDHAIIGTLGPILNTDPSSARIWANQIQDATLRQPIVARLQSAGGEKD